MSRIYAGDVKRGDMPKAAPATLVIVPSDNSRYEWHGKTLEQILANPPASVEKMITSLTTDGQKQPILVHPIAGNMLKVHAGFNRAVAGMLIVSRGLQPEFRLDCKVEDCNEKEAYRSSVIENHERTGTTVIDDAYAVRRMAQFGYTDSEIRATYGWGESSSWLTELRKILQLPDEMKEAIHFKRLSATAGIRLAKITDTEMRDNAFAEAKKDAGEAPVTDKHVRKFIKKERDPDDEFAEKPKALRIIEVREYWRERSLPGSNPPRVRRLADFVLRFMNGEIEVKSLDAELARL